ncbi:MAG: thiamine pyrophosphate-dependent dehydrogenase E1 component subunit alpha [Limnochordales bacterium]
MENRHAELGLSDRDVLEMYKKMLLARMVDERTWLLNRMGKVHFVISGQGHEAAQVGAAWALRPGTDWVLPYYRDLGVVLTLGMTVREIMLMHMAKADDPNSGGRQMPNHWSLRRLNIFTGSSPVGTQVPHAAGIAYAAKLRGDDIVVWTSYGEGTANKGDVHEGMNFAGVHKLPVIFFCENNGYAISVPREKQMAVENVSVRAQGYGFPGVTVDGTDVFAVYRAMKEAVDRARRGEGPTLIEAKVYRFTPHSSDDDDRKYRDPAEVERQKQHDPVRKLREYALARGILTEAHDEELRRQFAADIDEAIAYAEAAPDPEPSDLVRHVFAQ